MKYFQDSTYSSGQDHMPQNLDSQNVVAVAVEHSAQSSRPPSCPIPSPMRDDAFIKHVDNIVAAQAMITSGVATNTSTETLVASTNSGVTTNTSTETLGTSGPISPPESLALRGKKSPRWLKSVKRIIKKSAAAIFSRKI
ncbi:hypothetical protein PtrSN002B_011180 [Pyrenophora tritici-repentis]|uniref:Uncharacterized protein n=2 Tax=Pyrenophora tritici-repentis TaxID=45151 RepID=A0A2W1ER97_9PLEO|nr:uncharacterized protein PTRG_09076 [Pyrenophora tritici-repentis Pt-1C-BFP]KAF7442307.1 hypothetical protein A1F99_131760 [Pyrenophora tritici-repentis]EDU42127.1 predicted protein [Pyrenophora tritici-repentis Pt-1C-BFP]KAF7579320.1 hypothetical protein PtrM4_035600 [Pyrenophora tritici-repentis]KAG9378244.1 hypothetical protein A1F94_011360 [Pyrenophora tritici-repentis]KAI0569739.1 hypothetical protein Alg130_11520 [Pyrenophora tritici-repentis]